MADFPTALTNAVDNTTNVQAKHINNLEAKVGIDSSAVTTSHDYKLSGVTGSDKAASKAGSETLTNKTIDDDNNTLQNVATTALKNRTGSDANVVTGTAGTTNYTAKWDANGDIIDGYEVLDEDDMASDSATKLATQQSIKAYADSLVVSGYRASAYLSSNESTSSGVLETIVFDTENYDPQSDYNNATGIYTVSSAGVYLVLVQAAYSITADGDRIQLRIVGGGNNIGDSYFATGSAQTIQIQCMAIANLSASDTIYVQTRNLDNDDTLIGSSDAVTNLRIQRID